jgi:TatD DNase family protein
MPLVDTHAHLCDAAFGKDLEEVLRRAEERGVGAVVAVGEDLADARFTLSLARRHPLVRPAAGLYPSHPDPAAAAEVEAFIRENREGLFAVGEVGLDFWLAKDDESRAVQREIFSRFIRLAGELDLPLNVHSRSAGRHAVALLREHGARRVQMHAFDGKISAALPAVEAGYFFSVPPSVVRSRQKEKLVGHLPLDRLLAESDSPVLGPDPRERNEPANLTVVVDAIARIKELPRQEVVEALVRNTRSLYGDL